MPFLQWVFARFRGPDEVVRPTVVSLVKVGTGIALRADLGKGRVIVLSFPRKAAKLLVDALLDVLAPDAGEVEADDEA